MGFVYATIDLINGVDLLDARRHMIREDEIRRMSVRMECDVVGWVEIKFGNRRANCDAHVLPGNSEPLLGAIPMEIMDVVIEMKRQELVVNTLHPEGAMHRI
jgi:hypothetical protein